MPETIALVDLDTEETLVYLTLEAGRVILSIGEESVELGLDVAEFFFTQALELLQRPASLED